MNASFQYKSIFFCLLAILLLNVTQANAQQNPIQQENALPGTRSWQIQPKPAAFYREIEGYASHTSVNIGEAITFYVSTNAQQHFDIEIYRLGWYNGDGGRLIHKKWALIGKPQQLAEANRTTGLTEQDWILWDSPAAYSWTPPAGTVSGAFVAKLIGQNEKESYIPFVVRDDARTSDFLFQTAVTTYQAYNFYPGNLGDTDWRSGKSLYYYPQINGGSYGPRIPITVDETLRTKPAREVSFNRPYFPDNLNIYNSAGQFFQWEYNMVRWLEKEGYDVTYQTDVDTHARPETLAAGKHKVLLSVGHDEYWSWQMRETVEQARNRTTQPLNIGFFGANISHWQIRFADSTANTRPANAPNRTIVAYKSFADSNNPNLADPVFSDSDLTNNYLTTVLWRDNQKPSITLCSAGQSPNCNCPSQLPNCTKQPEDELVGVMTDLTNTTGFGNFEFAADSPAWVKAGMTNPNAVFTGLLGYEADRIFHLASYSNRVWNKIGESDFVGRGGTTDSHAVYYRMTTSGARVFAAGTVQWAWGLDKFGADTTYGPSWHANLYNSDVEVVTRNVLACLKNGGAACGS